MTAAKRATNATPKKARRSRNWKPAFLAAIATWPDVSKAAAAVGIAPSTAYRARQQDEDFALAWHDAINVSVDKVIAALFQRAIESDTTAAIFLAKSHRPEVYGERMKLEHSGRIGHDLEGLTDEQLDKVAQGLEALS